MAIESRWFLSYAVAVAAGVLGAGSLALFGLFLWMGAFGLIDLRMAERSRLAWDAGLCFLFFLQHSGMVRRSFRESLKGVVPEHWHAVLYTIASGVVLLALAASWQPSSVNVYVVHVPVRWLLRGLLLLCLAGVFWGIRSLRSIRRLRHRGVPGPRPAGRIRRGSADGGRAVPAAAASLLCIRHRGAVGYSGAVSGPAASQRSLHGLDPVRRDMGRTRSAGGVRRRLSALPARGADVRTPDTGIAKVKGGTAAGR